MNADLFNPTGDAEDRPPAVPAEPGQVPLADRMRPASLAEVAGQADLLGPKGPLRLLLESDSLPSLLLWGPPGCGKTTLARLVAVQTKARFLEYSAVAVGTKELKIVMGEAARLKAATGRRTILFLDEIHRFNKAQQDALLPWVEKGDVTLIGATTENPSFEVNSALISRTRLFVLKPLSPAHVQDLLERALIDPRGLADSDVTLQDAALELLANMSEGDARVALGLLETVVATREAMDADEAAAPDGLTADDVADILQNRAARYDKAGEEHFNIISALHKSLRNSDVQGAVYWLTRMLEGGEDPLYIARRLVRFASEDVGLADPQALPQALAARDAVHFIGLPEGALALTQAVVYLALAPKSTALYAAWKKTSKEVARGHNPPVPLHIRNAPTRLMKELDYGKGYVYAPDTANGIADFDCLPEALAGQIYYAPGNWGFEKDLADRMAGIKKWHQRQHEKKRRDTSGDQGGNR